MWQLQATWIGGGSQREIDTFVVIKGYSSHKIYTKPLGHVKRNNTIFDDTPLASGASERISPNTAYTCVIVLFWIRWVHCIWSFDTVSIPRFGWVKLQFRISESWQPFQWYRRAINENETRSSASAKSTMPSIAKNINRQLCTTFCNFLQQVKIIPFSLD